MRKEAAGRRLPAAPVEQEHPHARRGCCSGCCAGSISTPTPPPSHRPLDRAHAAQAPDAQDGRAPAGWRAARRAGEPGRSPRRRPRPGLSRLPYSRGSDVARPALWHRADKRSLRPSRVGVGGIMEILSAEFPDFLPGLALFGQFATDGTGFDFSSAPFGEKNWLRSFGIASGAGASASRR